jgi:Lon protease-like protein
MSDPAPSAERLGQVPLFPLPNVVLFPRAVLPLHIFEDRYKTMTADALESSRQIAMALLKPGWERDYYQQPAIEPVVCVGRILSYEKLADGKYNFLLQGSTRARIAEEIQGAERAYRVAEVESIVETPVMEIDLSNERQRLTWMFSDGALAEAAIGRQFRQLLAGPLPTADVADIIAFNFIEDVPLKQSLLADGDVRRRVSKVIAALDHMRPVLEARLTRTSDRTSMN